MSSHSKPLTEKISLDGSKPFHLLRDAIGEEVKRAAMACIDAQRRVVPVPQVAARQGGGAAEQVSEKALADILAGGDDVHGIATNGGISDVVVINAPNIGDSVHDEEVARLRAQLDRQVASMLRRVVQPGFRIAIRRSGQFWYPPGSHMGWHTNNRAPGWRVYLTHTSEPGRSFFRYRHPVSGEIVTSTDGDWDLRVFRVDPDRPLWHAVYSDTDRFSFGYVIVPQSLPRALLQWGKGMLARA